MKKRILSALALLLFGLNSKLIAIAGHNYLVRCNEKLIEVVMEDLFNPPVSSRVYVYPNIAAYEVLCLGNPKLISLSGQIKHLPKINIPYSGEINYSIASEFAFTTVAKKLVFTEQMINAFEKEEKDIWKKQNIDTNLINSSIRYGILAGKQIIDWLNKDNYIQVKAMERYVLQESIGSWRPTAPEYQNAMEPNWPSMRPLVMDSAGQIKSAPNLVYSEKKNSAFYKIANDVYKTAKSLDTVQKTIALFWDCNPNISYSKGHITYFVHKISPGGHWIKIAGQACNNLNFDEIKTAEVYALLSIGLYDAFLSCWSEKFRSHGIRPETYINRLIDAKWLPYIQTPPFPEYTSGHSVISNASSYILTRIIPQPYAYSDSSEMYIGIPPRSFKSFAQASEEATISRFYGGIHFLPACNNGAEQGKKVGELVLEKIKTHK